MGRPQPKPLTIPFDEASLSVNRREPRKRRIVTVWNEREAAALKSLATHTGTESCALIRAVVVGSARALGLDVGAYHAVDGRQLTIQETAPVEQRTRAAMKLVTDAQKKPRPTQLTIGGIVERPARKRPRPAKVKTAKRRTKTKRPARRTTKRKRK